jgi:hypothetical protein
MTLDKHKTANCAATSNGRNSRFGLARPVLDSERRGFPVVTGRSNRSFAAIRLTPARPRRKTLADGQPTLCIYQDITSRNRMGKSGIS